VAVIPSRSSAVSRRSAARVRACSAVQVLDNAAQPRPSASICSRTSQPQRPRHTAAQV
jgi:hypothetical protein